MIDQQYLLECRAQLERVLKSSVFQSSKQTCDFLNYVCDRVLSGATSIDQAEIAEEVLGRQDFDPTTDASVRKLASSARQRLEKYYEGPGANDEIVISLPLRSYAPQFQIRNAPPQPAPNKQSRWALVGWLSIGALVLAAVATVLDLRSPQTPAPGEVEIRTQMGDLTHPRPDAAPGALQLGPTLAAVDEIAAEVSFRPEHEGQHAGLIIWEGPSRWVALGRRFTSRNYLALSYQYDTSSGHEEAFDVEGQSGRPVWLRLARIGDLFRAYASADGLSWAAIGGEVRVPLRTRARGGVFAFNGRRPSPSIPARFRLAGVGPVLLEKESPPEGSPWSWRSSCPDGADVSAGGPETAALPRCHVLWRRQFSPRKPFLWSVTTRVDAPSTPELSAGLFLETGTDRRLRLVRYYSEKPVLALIQDGRFLDPSPDYAGSPPIYLRLRGEEQGGEHVVAEASLDGVEFRRIGHPLPASSLGAITAFGVIASKRSPAGSAPIPSVRLFFVRQDLFPLEAMRFDLR